MYARKSSRSFLENSDSNLPNFHQKKLLYKILVVGDYGVGKSAILRRYIEDKFSSNYKLTVGADFQLKIISWDNNTKINLQLWDIAGTDRFSCMTRAYYKFAAGVVVVFDVTRIDTFHSVSKWLKDVRDKVFKSDGSDIPVILLANKVDTSQSVISGTHLIKFCKNNGIDNWFFTSAKENICIEEAMNYLIEKIVQTERNFKLDDGSFKLTEREMANVRKQKYSCCNSLNKLVADELRK